MSKFVTNQVFDWEFSGWGPSAADVTARARPALAVYWYAVRETWPGLEYMTLQQLMRVRTLFGLVAWIGCFHTPDGLSQR